MTSSVYQAPQIVPVTEVNSRAQKSDLKSLARTFFDELTRVMMEYADPDKGMVIRGIPIEAGEKTGVVGTFLIGQLTNDIGNALESIINLQSFIINEEKNLANIRG
jgi:hypothetical protein